MIQVLGLLLNFDTSRLLAKIIAVSLEGGRSSKAAHVYCTGLLFQSLLENTDLCSRVGIDFCERAFGCINADSIESILCI